MTRIANTALLTIASGLLAMTSPAFASAVEDLPQATLNVAGTDFTSVKAVAHLKNRVRRAALTICAPDWDGKIPLSMDQRECYDTALRNGVAQIESRRLEALRQTSTDVAAAQPEEHPTH